MCIKSGLGGFSSLSPLVISHNGLTARLMAILSPPARPRCHLRPDILLSDRPLVFLEPAEKITAVGLLWRDNDTTRAARGQSRPRVAFTAAELVRGSAALSIGGLRGQGSPVCRHVTGRPSGRPCAENALFRAAASQPVTAGHGAA